MNLSFTQLNIGCLSRNRYWGEPEDQAFRKAKCTSTLISGPEGFLLVDPGVPREEMEQLLDERSKVSIQEIRAIFFTHLHGDHRVDALSYPSARLLASQTEIDAFRRQEPEHPLLSRLEAAPKELFPGVEAVPLPGHTEGCTGLTLEALGERVLIAGDAVMTRDFFLHETGYFNSWDHKQVKETIQKIKKRFSLIVPGHDILFYHQSSEQK